MSLQINQIVEKIVKSPLTHFYFFAGGASQSVFRQDLERSLEQFRSIIKKACYLSETTFTLQTPHQHYRHYEIVLPRKTVHLKEISVKEFTPESWNPFTSFLFLPGGEARLIHEQLGSKLDALHSFWEQGGKIWAQCGSAYWLSKKRTFVFSNSNTCVTENPKALFHGNSYGPLYDAYVAPRIGMAQGFESTRALLAGGGSFTIPESMPNKVKFEPLVYYEDLAYLGKIAAVIGTNDLGGAMMLIHVHLNYQSSDVDVGEFSAAFPAKGNWNLIKEELQKSEDSRMMMVARILDRMCSQELSHNR